MLLRSFRPEDVAVLFELVHKNRQHLRPWLNWVDATTKPEHCLQFIEDAQLRQYAQEGVDLGLWWKEELVGAVGMYGWDHGLRKATVGYWIAENCAGKGLVKAAVSRFLDFLFQKLNLNKVEILFVSHNRRSAALAEKLGARVEGVLRDSYLLNGELCDLVITGILSREWSQTNRPSAGM